MTLPSGASDTEKGQPQNSPTPGSPEGSTGVKDSSTASTAGTAAGTPGNTASGASPVGGYRPADAPGTAGKVTPTGARAATGADSGATSDVGSQHGGAFSSQGGASQADRDKNAQEAEALDRQDREADNKAARTKGVFDGVKEAHDNHVKTIDALISHLGQGNHVTGAQLTALKASAVGMGDALKSIASQQ